jgi:hypothetical protein
VLLNPVQLRGPIVCVSSAKQLPLLHSICKSSSQLITALAAFNIPLGSCKCSLDHTWPQQWPASRPGSLHEEWGSHPNWTGGCLGPSNRLKDVKIWNMPAFAGNRQHDHRILWLKTTVRNKYYSCSILLCTTTTCIGDTRATGCITQQLSMITEHAELCTLFESWS